MEGDNICKGPQSQVRSGKPSLFNGLEGFRRAKDKTEETSKFEEPGDSSVSEHACMVGTAESSAMVRREDHYCGAEEKRSQFSAVTEESERGAIYKGGERRTPRKI